jgi:branched-chain amino acid aminotransferase
MTVEPLAAGDESRATAARDDATVAAMPSYDQVFVDGDFTTADDARVSVKSHALSYGTGTIEGIRATWSEERQELYLIEPLGHYERLRGSANALGLPLEHSPQQLVNITIELLRRNEVRADAYIRPILFLAGDQLPVRMHDIEPRLVIYAVPFPAGYIPVDGVRCLVSSWRRIPDAAMPVRAKIIGSYVNSALAKTEAVQAGLDEAIMLTVDGDVAEGTTSNLFLRRGSTWITPPVTDDILEGITRRQVITLIADELGERVIERTVDRSEVYVADEALLCGTAVQVVPLLEVDRRPVGGGLPGERTRRLMAVFDEIVKRNHARYLHWTVPVR